MLKYATSEFYRLNPVKKKIITTKRIVSIPEHHGRVAKLFSYAYHVKKRRKTYFRASNFSADYGTIQPRK